jgi:hypothetical protein
MNRQSYKTKRQGQRKRSSKVTGSKRHIGVTGKKVSFTQPHLHEIYASKAEWIKKVIPPAKEQNPS